MQEILITKIPNLRITFDGQRVELPSAILARVRRHWSELIRDNPHLYNGEAFTVTDVKEHGGTMTITLAETDYAHYLYSHQVGDLGQYTVRIIHPATLIISNDGRFIFGSMGKHTSRSGLIQCCGGGLDRTDIKDGVVQVAHRVTEELMEELGLDTQDTARVADCYPAYLKSGGPTGKMTTVYVSHIKETAEEFLGKYKKFVQALIQQGEQPEFSELFSIPAQFDPVEKFIKQYGGRLDEYMAVTLRQAQSDFAKTE